MKGDFPMILEFSVANTLSIKEKQTISFEAVQNNELDDLHFIKTDDGKKILKMACVYGANASGKSNILVALNLYLNFILYSFTELKPSAPIPHIPFLFTDKIKNGEFELIFYIPQNDNLIRYEYYISLNMDCVVKETLFYAPKKQRKLLYQRDMQNIKWGTDILGVKKIISDLTRTNCTVLAAGAQANQPILANIHKYLNQRYKGIILSELGKLEHDVLKLMEENIEFKSKVINILNASDISPITDIEIVTQEMPDDFFKLLPADIKQEFSKKGEKPKKRDATFTHKIGDSDFDLPYKLESNGTRRMLELSMPLVDLSESSLVLIDEIESSLHQDLLEMLIKLFLTISNDSQLIFTTHNQDLLDSGLLRDDEIWFCIKGPDGSSKYNSVTDYIGIRKEVSRKKYYQADKFGGIPNIDFTKLGELFSAKKDK